MKAKIVLPTSEEITRRLRIVSEMRNLCLSLSRAKRMGLVHADAPPRGVETTPVLSRMLDLCP